MCEVILYTLSKTFCNSCHIEWDWRTMVYLWFAVPKLHVVFKCLLLVYFFNTYTVILLDNKKRDYFIYRELGRPMPSSERPTVDMMMVMKKLPGQVLPVIESIFWNEIYLHNYILNVPKLQCMTLTVGYNWIPTLFGNFVFVFALCTLGTCKVTRFFLLILRRMYFVKTTSRKFKLLLQVF